MAILKGAPGTSGRSPSSRITRSDIFRTAAGFGPPIDTAPELRATSAMALVVIGHPAALTICVNLLVDLQTTDFSNAGAAGVTLKFGTSPSPAACTGASDTTCGHHLTGSASFQIATDSPTDAAAAGEIVGGAFSGGPTSVSVKLGLGGNTTSTLRLQQGRVRIAGISDAGIMTGTLGGLISPDELKTELGPPLLAILNQTLDTDCTGARTPPGCGCGVASKGSIVISIVDQDKNCVLTTDEMFGNSTVAPMLQPGSCSKDSCATPGTLSMGVRFKAVKATFPM